MEALGADVRPFTFDVPGEQLADLRRRVAATNSRTVRPARRLPGANAIRADARRFRQLVVSDTAKGRTADLFTQGLQTRGPLELDLGDRIGAL
jgi:hypothetical protein